MNSYFRLIAHGRDFDVAAASQIPSLHFDRTWQRGEPKSRCAPKSVYKTSGVQIDLGDGREIVVPEQQRLALAFLREHAEALRALGGLPGADTFVLGLHRSIELPDNLCGFTVSVSDSLAALSLDLGISPVTYVELERDLDSAECMGR